MPGDPIGVVLAGGLSSRMGRSKAMVELAGTPLVLHALRAMREASLTPSVVAKPSSELPPLECAVIHEPERPLHPLLGIATAISSDPGLGGPIVVMPCDMPFVPPALLGWLSEQPEPLIVCEGGGRLHPLLGRYDPSVESGLRAAIEGGTSAQDATRALGARVVAEEVVSNFGPPARVLFNVNDADDLAEAERIARA